MKILRENAGRFPLYLLVGLSAAAVDFGMFWLLTSIDVWYVAASITSSLCAIVVAFLGHKYVVFGVRDKFLKHLARYLLADLASTAAGTGILFVLVEGIGMDTLIAKGLSMIIVTSWHFFVLKMLVYV